MLTAEVPFRARFRARSRPDSPAPMIAILVIVPSSSPVLCSERPAFLGSGRPAPIPSVPRVATSSLTFALRRVGTPAKDQNLFIQNDSGSSSEMSPRERHKAKNGDGKLENDSHHGTCECIDGFHFEQLQCGSDRESKNDLREAARYNG